jgi:hypothetical protein
MLRPITILSFVLLAAPLAAQDPESTVSRIPPGVFFAIGADVVRPSNEFRPLIGRPVGIAGHLTYPLVTARVVTLGVRGEISWVRHAKKQLRDDAALAREFFGGNIGPQLSIIAGPVRPYVSGGFGTTSYYTVLRIDENCPDEDSCVDQDVMRRSDYEETWVWTGGVYVSLQRKSPNPILMHVSWSDRHGGRPDVRTFRDGLPAPAPRARYGSLQIGFGISTR